MKNFAFIILHYQAIADTIEGIKSIKATIKDANYSIVIVDNDSPNDTGDELLKLYEKEQNVYVLKAEENLGFAKGNNLGYKFAKEKLEPDFMIVMNNDMILKQAKFLTNIEKLYEETKFDIAGPVITTVKNGANQNPSSISYDYSKKGIVKAIKNRKTDLLKIKYGIYRPLKLLKRVAHKFFLTKPQYKDYLKLHGSCLIFSKEYITKYNGFFSKTFMYMEEDIFAYISQRERLKVVYDENIEIYHKEDAATDLVYLTESKKLKFILENEIDSLNEFYKIIDDDKHYKENIVTNYNK